MGKLPVKEILEAERKKNKTKKLSPQELLNDIIDIEALERRKSKPIQKKKENIIIPATKELQWWQKPVQTTDFKIAEYENLFYAQLNVWKKNIWIGPYSSNTEIEKVIADYCKYSKSKTKNRKGIKKLHSIIIEINDNNKQ